MSLENKPSDGSPAVEMPWTYILRVNGVPTTLSDGVDGEGFRWSPQGEWKPLQDDGLMTVQEECVRMHDHLATRIFGSLSHYYSKMIMLPRFVLEAGLNSEAAVSRDQFEQLLVGMGNQIPELNRFLYLYDCRMLVSSIQECSKEVSQLTGEFYRCLNIEPFFPTGVYDGDDVRWTSSPTITYLFATLGFIFIRMHSLLDYLAKLAREVDAICEDFRSYPRLKSANFLFGDKRRLKVNERAGTVFEKCDLIDEIETVRNRLIHDGLLDDMPKAYEVISDGKVTERFVLMPDRTGRQFDSYRGRRLFYGREDKINLRLTGVVRDFHQRQAATLREIRPASSAT